MKTRLFLFTTIIALTLSNCGNDNETTTEPQTELKQFLSVNPSSPLLLRIEKEDNTIIEYYGDKDNEGRALNCNLISVKTPETEEPIYTLIDEEGRPTKVFGYEGASVAFDYDKIDDIRIDVISANGNDRLNFPLKDYHTSNKSLQSSASRNIRKGKKIKLINTLIANDKAQSSCNISNLNVNINKCGEPFDYATVILVANGVDAPYAPRYKSRSNGNGNYCFLIEKPEPSAIQIDDICNSVESVLGTLCTGLDFLNTIPGGQITLCATISSAFTAASLPVFVGCEILINSMNIYCSTLGASPIPGGPSILTNLCNSDALDENIPSEFVFKTGVYIDGSGFFRGEDTNSFQTSGPFPDINIDLPSVPSIADFSTNPSDPNPEQDYIATAVIECLETPSTAIITVVGTDDYTDSITVNLPSGNSTISLSVPGAEGGIKDFLSVEVEGLSTSTRVILF